MCLQLLDRMGSPQEDSDSDMQEIEEIEESLDEVSVENGIDNEEIELLNKSLGIATSGSMSPEITSKKPLRGLILTPTRELTLQVTSHLEVFGKICGVRFVAVVGGMSIQKQERLLNSRL